MFNTWPYGNADVPTKIHYTVWLMVILSLVDFTDFRIIRRHIKKRKKQATETSVDSRIESTETAGKAGT